MTNDPELVRAFKAKHGRIVYKSISGLRSIVTEFGEDRSGSARGRCVPARSSFRPMSPDSTCGVHVVGDEEVTTRIDSNGTDYRYADHGEGGTALEPFDLPGDLADRCRRLGKGLGLAFSGIDLRIVPNGSVYCFEVNPSPAYSYYESHTGQPISLALARYLAGYGR